MSDAPELLSFLAIGVPEAQAPFPRFRLDGEQWQRLLLHLTIADWALLSLWGEPRRVHAAFLEPASGAIAVASLDCPGLTFPSLSGVRPGAIRLERAAQDLFGLEAKGLVDARPWLDHGQWPRPHPLSDRAEAPAPRPAAAYPFLEAAGEGLHQIPVGPVHAGIIEPGHFRFHANGETVVRLEERLGYVHKGDEGLMAGKTPAAAARVAARLSGDSTVACSLAFARAVEAATGTEVPPRAHWLRALMAELERIANHCGDIGAICNDATFPFLLAQFGILREKTLRTAAQTFGHRLMMDVVVPGGVARDVATEGLNSVRDLLAELPRRLAELIAVYDGKPSLLDRTVGTGKVASDLIQRFAAGGYVGRASGRDFDARRAPGYPPYDALALSVPVLSDGDVHSRLLIRAHEIEASAKLLAEIVARLPAGDNLVPLGTGTRDGMALVEGFRGEILAWVALAGDGAVRRAHLRDPSWLQWPLLEIAIEGNIVADFPLCNKSFNCSYSGQDG